MQILAQTWPFFGRYMEKLLVESIAPSIRASNTHLQTFTFTKVDMGEKVHPLQPPPPPRDTALCLILSAPPLHCCPYSPSVCWGSGHTPVPTSSRSYWTSTSGEQLIPPPPYIPGGGPAMVRPPPQQHPIPRSYVGDVQIDVEVKKFFCKAGVKGMQVNGGGGAALGAHCEGGQR